MVTHHEINTINLQRVQQMQLEYNDEYTVYEEAIFTAP